MKKAGLLVFMSAFLFIFSSTTLAQTFGSNFNYVDVSGWVKIILGNPNLPNEWFQGINVFYYIVFPFIAIMTVIFGILTDVRIFRDERTKWILSFTMAAMTLPTGWLMAFVYYVYTFAASFAVVVFAAVFILGTIFWGIGRGYSFKGELMDVNKDLQNIRSQLRDLDNKLIKDDITEEDYRKKVAILRAKEKHLRSAKSIVQEEGAV